MRRIKKVVVNKLAYVLVLTPWYRAYLIAATSKYKNSPLWRNRAIEFGETYANESFVTNLRSELPLFKWLVRKDKRMLARIVLAPYSVTL